MHRHFCDAEGHDWQCSGDCECICGLPMEGHDHSECPVELRACPEHAAEFQRRNRALPRRKPKPSACVSNGKHGLAANAGAPATVPARWSACACIATIRTQTTARQLKTGISLSIVPERPRR
jgi:hypothetical protein